MGILSIIALALFLGAVAYTVKRRTAVFVAGFFILFPLIYRSIDITYLDLFGPIYASEINRFVGGDTATPIFVFAAFAVLFPLLVLFPDRGRRLARLSREPRAPLVTYHKLAANSALVVLSGLVAALFINMMLLGSVPLFTDMDRLDFDRIAGPVHNGAYELNFLVNFALGAFMVLPRLNGRAFDLRFAILMFVLLGYWVLAGNRFSVFFLQLTFFFMPMAAVLLAKRVGVIPEAAPDSSLQRFIASRPVRVVSLVMVALMLVGLVVNSYYNVRDYRSPLEAIEERVLVQPVELWAATWERVDFGKTDEFFSEYAFNEIVINPIDPTRNTTIQFLMTLELGYFRSAELTEAGQQYNGGYPEVHYELFGAWLPFLTLPLAGLLCAWLIRLCIVLLYRNLIGTSLAAVYVFYGVSLHFLGGGVTFVLAPTYWLKVLILVIFYIAEQRLLLRHARGGRGAAAAFSPAYPRRPASPA